MIEASALSLTYPDGTVALREVNLSIPHGSLVYIVGASGSGKTSLLKLLMGMELPTSGVLKVDGFPMGHLTREARQKLRQRIGPIFQGFRLIPGKTSVENVLMGLRFLGLSHRAMVNAAQEALDAVGLSEKAQTDVSNLSFGQAQRVAIARAVARGPRLILADEPTGNLDHDNARKILSMLEAFRSHDTTVIITTHATHLIDPHLDAIVVTVDSGSIRIDRQGVNA